jgi:hypothetical protein
VSPDHYSEDLGEQPERCAAATGGHQCDDDATEVVDMHALTGDESAPEDLPLCAYHALEYRAYWKRLAAAEEI